MKIIDIIFDFFTAEDKRNDPYKDENNKGIIERFNEVIAEDIDDNIISLVNNLIPNIHNPKECFNRYVPLLEQMMGFDYDKNLIYFYKSLEWRRRLLQGALNRYAIKGTKRGYSVLFSMLGMETNIIEYYQSTTFDTGTFDNPTKVFDNSSTNKTGYGVYLTGGINFTDEVEAAVINIIEFNEPINAELIEVTYNEQPVNLTGDFNSDFSNDFFNFE